MALFPTLGLAWFACAASDFDAGRMGVYCDITSENPTHISPPPAFPIQPKADIGLSVKLVKAKHKVAQIKKSLKFCYWNF